MFHISSRNIARTAELRIGPVIGRQLFPACIVAISFLFLWDRLPTIDFSLIWKSLHQVSLAQWLVATSATAASFWALGHYDKIVHGLMATGVDRTRARISGTTAVAIAQFVGFGVLSSALVRWRLLPEISLASSLRLSIAVSASFLFGWAIVTSATILITGYENQTLQFIATLTLAFASVFVTVLIWQPAALGRLPSLQAAMAVVFLVLIDTLFAGAALYALLPADFDVAPAALLTAFLIAVGCGLVGGTPGGVGPFELALIAALPGVAHEPLLAAALAFRLVYYVLPAVIAFIVLIYGTIHSSVADRPHLSPPQPSAFLAPKLERALWRSDRAEVNLVRQGGFGILSQNDQPIALVALAGQSLIMLSDQISKSRRLLPAIFDFADCASTLMRTPLIYKCSGRTAVAARSVGWTVLPVAQEAWVRPQGFNTNSPAHRQLRRLLRKARRSGIAVAEAGRQLPLDEMQKVSDEWINSHGKERGFSMGKFGRDYISCQRVFLAYQGGELRAFITLHEVQIEWSLDLMRHSDTIADGVMHLLVIHAIESAAAALCPRLSLAAIPCANVRETAKLATLRHCLVSSSGTK
ncbi:MAG: phosphatidylglycerol lysyltransferase domain-containing protein, partial [Paracoccaceae bacterium]